MTALRLARDMDLTGSAELLSGVLEPGTYFLYAAIENPSAYGQNSQSFSKYAGPIHINAKPVLEFRSPSRMSGREYASDDRGNAWDMTTSGDVP